MATKSPPRAAAAQAVAPDAFHAEQAVLGAVLAFAEAFDAATTAGLAPEDMGHAEHRAIWIAVAQLRGRRLGIDVVTTFEQLRSMGADERAGGLLYLQQLADGALNTRTIPSHVELIKAAAYRRRLQNVADAVRQAAGSHLEGEALRQRIAVLADQLRPAESAAAGERIQVEWADELPADLQPPAQIVENMLTAGGMSMMFGESNSGKSYLAIHLAICLSAGLPWLGRRTRQGAVLYIAAEGAWSIRLRLAAYRKHFGREIGRFGLIPQALSLLDPSADVEGLIELIKVKLAELGEPVLMIVIDTVARVMVGGDENAAQDMARLVGAGDRIRQETGAHLLYIHHAGKDASRGARGHSSLRAALDTEIEVTADEATKTHTAHVTKQRDLPSKGDRLTAQFVSVELGTDQWGGAITACAVVEADEPQRERQPRAMTPTQRAVMGYLAAKEAAVKKADIRDALVNQGINRASVYRALNDLLLVGLVTESMGLIYAPKS